MSTAYEAEGRTHQKQRTRAALVAAAREQVARGLAPTVEEAAEAASVSRATAYRYFPNQHALLAAAHPETIQSSMLPPDAPADDPAARVDLVVEAFTRLISETEAQQRTMLRLSLEAPRRRSELPLRQGRAIGWIEEALAPLEERIDDDTRRRLALAIRSVSGIEVLVWLTDVAGLQATDAVQLMRWAAHAILHAALEGDLPPISHSSSSSSRSRGSRT